MQATLKLMGTGSERLNAAPDVQRFECALTKLFLLTTLLLSTSSNARLRMLYLVGLGLSDERDISVKGLDIVRKASRVYLEAYTSILLVDKSKLVGDLRLFLLDAVLN